MKEAGREIERERERGSKMERNNEREEEILLLNSLCLVVIISQFAADSQLGVDPLLPMKSAYRTATDCGERRSRERRKRLAIHPA
jgi:hypothetical protein